MGVFGVLSVCLETQRAVFGVPLIGLRRSGQMRQGLPLALMHIVEFVEKHGLRESGLFRVGGKVKRCQELRKSFDQGGVPEFDSEDIPTLASLLKLFLRELPGGLIPEPHRTQLLNVFRDSKEEEMNQALRTILNSLPEEHFNVLCYLSFFLSRVAAGSHLNLMTSKNLSIVFGPTIFHVPLSPTMVEEQGLCNALTEHLLNNLKHLLPNMYPHVSTSNTAEAGDTHWTDEECAQQLPLTEIRSELPKIGRLGRLRKRLRSFGRKFCSCFGSNKIENGEVSA
ncbi:protein FAM13A-like [Ctenopharyngodon idella]|uniref:protein FAM13A-like n=1 Tax=Ctenopharyngodon idella TaxID=7959 RepID=UPI002230B8AA|nr:protein FAM13A-like [Ctenopharyngodon idella]XP_051736604.1 protein FAM13A-like [Ctenopharyngodon idella]